MKAHTFVARGLIVLALALGGSAFAQKEQWLEYHPITEPESYQFLELSTNPPPGMAVPKCNAQPYFGHWTTPMDPAGRWLCLDRNRKSGPYDRIFVDAAGTGKFDEKAVIIAKRMDSYNAFFDPVKIVFKGEDGPVAYHLLVRSVLYDGGKPELLLSSGGSYVGSVEIGGQKRRIELIDGNVNGSFNDQGPALGERDSLVIKGAAKDSRRYLGRMVEVDGAFYRIEVARDGAYVKIQKAENVVLGQVRVPETISEFVAVGENGHFVRKPVKGEFTLPVGRYRPVGWTIERKDGKGAAWTLNGYGFQKNSEFDVAASQAAVVAAGEPVRVLLQRDEGSSPIDFRLEFRGPSDETVRFLKGGQNPSPPKLMLASADGVYHWTNSFEFG